jgi:hypothetical protein
MRLVLLYALGSVHLVGLTGGNAGGNKKWRRGWSKATKLKVSSRQKAVSSSKKIKPN